jgi:hypothetical protein
MTTAAAIAALLLAAAPARPARPARPTPAAPAAPAAPQVAPAPVPPPAAAPRPEGSPAARVVHRGTGKVDYATAAQAYLDAGAEDGLAAGAVVELRRGPNAIGRCTVEVVAPHHAACTGAPARAGDTFTLPTSAAEAPPPRLLPPPPPEDVLARRRAVVQAAPVPLVAFAATAPSQPVVMPRTRAVDLALTHQTWDVSPGGASSKESLDLLARGVPLTTWLFLDLDARLEHWTARQAARFRPQDKTQLYVWQAQLTAIPSDALSITAGRVLPWGVPGATVFDGAMAAWRGGLGEARAEVGLFAGTVPQPDSLRLTGERATGGAYWSLDRRLGDATLRTEGRLAAVRTPELGTRGEATLTGRLFTPRLDLSAEAGLGAGGKAHAQGYLDAARVDATLRPAPRLALGGSFRYTGLGWPQSYDPPALPGRAREGDGFVTFDATRWLRVGAAGGFAEDVSSGAGRRWIGPEATFPRLLWGWGTVSAGYLEERGWVAGRSAYGQLVATPWRPIWLLARVAWSHEDGAGLLQDEASLTLGGRAELNRYLSLRLTLVGRTGLDGAGEGARPHGLSAFATLASGF